MNMFHGKAKSRIQGLFVDYYSLLTIHEIAWNFEDNQNVAVLHVFSDINPATLPKRLESDLSILHHELKKDFQKFFKHAVKLSKAFEIVNAGPRKKQDYETKNRSGNAKRSNKDEQATK